MSNSKLVSYTKISPNKTAPRNHKIDTLTIHCYVGNVSVESMGEWFSQQSAQASANYGIGVDGRIGLFVEEKDRSWCSSNRANDNRAITIECASDTVEPYKINDKVYASLIKLCTDICKRNGIKELKWKADKSLVGHVDKQNMTVHRWFANKACPGNYIYSRLGKIAAEVNANLGVKNEDTSNVDLAVTDRKIGDTTLFRIAQVVYGEAGVIGSQNALRAVAQCVLDMYESGNYGSSLTDVMKHNFYAYSNNTATSEEAKRSVYDVFIGGKRRFPNDKIYQFRSFTNYSDGNLKMNSKCDALLQKYDYLGEDHKDAHWGHFYFGKKGSAAEYTPITNNNFAVRVDIPNLNIRTGPGTNYATTGHCTGIGTFTITEKRSGKGSDSGWGKLLSGAGWIALDYVKKK